MSHRAFRSPILCLAALVLSACVFQRADDAAAAKTKMIGMSKEQVLACMGVPKQRMQESATEVWSYYSSDGYANAVGQSYRTGSVSTFGSFHERSFCTVNVVMVNGQVSALNYSGPSGGLLAPDEQCGYAVKHCVDK